jgi:hypothetical protein
MSDDQQSLLGAAAFTWLVVTGILISAALIKYLTKK